MGHSIDRRTVLKASAAGIGAGVLLPGMASAADGDDDDVFPPVPGMLGDRRANEMWYQFDQKVFYDPSPEVVAAYQTLGAYVGGSHFVDGLRDDWLKLSAQPGYPDNYRTFVTPVRPELELLSGVQLDEIYRYYQPNSPELIEAFSWFGQGVLFDPRRAGVADQVHSMYGDPPTGYHGWHAYLRAMMFLDISPDRWRELDPLIAFAWAVQSIAKPDLNTPNPGLPAATVESLKARWLPRTVEGLDRDFRSIPYPEGIS